MDNHKYIFIVGRPRSGTTLLLRLFDGHKDCLTINSETALYRLENRRNDFADQKQRFLHLVGRPYDYDNNTSLPYEFEIDENINWEMRKFYQDLLVSHQNPGYCREQLFSVANKSTKDILQVLYKLHAEAFKKGTLPFCLLEKTPSHEYNIKRIKEDYEDVLFLHTLRDPFSVIASRNVSQKKRSLVSEVQLWKKSLMIYLENKKANPEKHLLVRFESLVGNPVNVMKQLSASIGIDFNPVLSSPTENNGCVLWESHANRAEKPEKGVVDASMSQRNIENDMNIDELKVIGEWLGRLYQFAGYKKNIQYCSKPTAYKVFQEFCEDKKSGMSYLRDVYMNEIYILNKFNNEQCLI